MSHRLKMWTGAALACAVVAGAAHAATGAPASGQDQAAGVTFIDGGVIDISKLVRAQSPAKALTTVPLGNRVTLTDGTQLNASAVLSFTWTSDIVSVLLYDEARPASGTIVNVVEGPSGPRPEKPSTVP